MSRIRVRRFVPLALPLAALGTLAASAAAQCSNPAISLSANVGTDGIVHASTWWYPDGPGPAAPVVVLGGDHPTVWRRQAGTWAPLGAGPTQTIDALVELPNGDVVVASQLPVRIAERRAAARRQHGRDRGV